MKRCIWQVFHTNSSVAIENDAADGALDEKMQIWVVARSHQRVDIAMRRVLAFTIRRVVSKPSREAVGSFEVLHIYDFGKANSCGTGQNVVLGIFGAVCTK